MYDSALRFKGFFRDLSAKLVSGNLFLLFKLFEVAFAIEGGAIDFVDAVI